MDIGIEEKLGATIALTQPLRDEQGRTVTLAGLVDKPTLLTLNYFRCAGVCTPQLQGVVEVLNRTRAEPGKDFQVITVSFDPRDTPAIAARKRDNHLQVITRPMPPGAWRFLTGDPAATGALAESVGFRFRPQGEDFVHPAALIMLSPQGRVTRYMYGITYLPADLELAVLEAAAGEARPTINKMLQICFSYDPEGRRYVFSFTRLAGSLILAAAAGFVLVLVLKGRRGKEGT
jgi:protein SCO1/2